METPRPERAPADAGSTLRALAALSLAMGVRLLREGLVVRALAWPGLLSAAALVGSTALVALLSRSPEIAIPLDQPAVFASLTEAGFSVVQVEDPERAAREGEVAAAAWPDDEGWTLQGGQGPGVGARAEGAIRSAIGAPWTLELNAPPARSREGGLAVRAMAGLLSVLFALYGVVLGAGTIMRDRQGAVLEAEHSLPVPFILHGLARLLAATVAMAVALGITLLLLHALVGVPEVLAWAWHGTWAAAAGAALGVGAMGGRGEGFSAPLSRALTASLGLFALGWSAPALGAWLPLASLAALIRGQSHLAPSLVVLLGTALMCGLAARRAAARGVA